MRALIALIAIVYLVGFGVALSPTIQGEWNSSSPSSFGTSIVQALPNALAWPARIWRHWQAGVTLISVECRLSIS